MKRPIRIGLIAEGEAELGQSVPYVKPTEGGKVIDRTREGALHRLIRRQLQEFGFSDCQFVQRHPGSQEVRKGKIRVGHSILDKKYLAQTVLVWLPDEVDMIVIVVDADEQLSRRSRDIATALQTIRSCHLDENEKPILDRSAGGIAIKNFDTWLIADIEQVQRLLSVLLPDDLPNDLETLPGKKAEERLAKRILDEGINQSVYLKDVKPGLRELRVRWELGAVVDLSILQKRCSQGYKKFSTDLQQAANAVVINFDA